MTKDNENESEESSGGIPVGKHGFIEISLKKQYVIPFRLIMLLAATPFLKELVEIILSGESQLGSFVAVKGEHWGYYAEFFKVLAFSIFLLWLGTFGTKAKSEKSDDEP